MTYEEETEDRTKKRNQNLMVTRDIGILNEETIATELDED
jgi:hypothetical protein